MPVLIDEHVVIYELAAICAYLADKFPEKNLAPALGDPKRGLYYRWLFLFRGHGKPWQQIKCETFRFSLSKNVYELR